MNKIKLFFILIMISIYTIPVFAETMFNDDIMDNL
mgnify:CR=1 FL=1